MSPFKAQKLAVIVHKRKSIIGTLLGMAGLLAVAGCGGVPEHERECQWQGTPSWYCRHTAKKDTYFVRGNTQSYFIPVYTGAKEFPVPDMPVYTDETIDQTLRASIVLTDYKEALRKTELLALVERQGPYTVFAVPNHPMEHPSFAIEGSLMDVQNENLLKQLMGYTIVLGDYPPEKLRKLALKNGGSVELTTFYNEKLIVSINPETGEFVTKNKAGQINKIWVNGIPQANGTLYVSQGLLNFVK
ncbi:fasciclin domain-containing protein [Commensalibacter nepenthis]|uniref:FAS1 domain-containing protein n=1 Tax=Commensalibacter nepenthis TaxID=3043872 RepID=A0ABT6Q8X8_9PROT|nr:hypothetical protein [Commensalibacter sp. TBRC 10068]MDI2113368.1 hypothetical protein [Commensalibacter sp. TBRC 10068]